jgi:hypothetical protein
MIPTIVSMGKTSTMGVSKTVMPMPLFVRHPATTLNKSSQVFTE